ASRKINGETGKVMLRQIVKTFVGDRVSEAPKRPVQTPQREWLSSELKDWADEMIQAAKNSNWLNQREIKSTWSDFLVGKGDNSFFIWQWISIGMMKMQSKISVSNAQVISG
ncbi:MAG: asparagine synthase-related protein, partial [Pyrinomonadaceae bacterium]